jgi:hypothetical protein
MHIYACLVQRVLGAAGIGQAMDAALHCHAGYIDSGELLARRAVCSELTLIVVMPLCW